MTPDRIAIFGIGLFATAAFSQSETGTANRLRDAITSIRRYSNVRVAARIVNAEIERATVELQLIDFEKFTFNRVLISHDTLTDPFHRKAVENLAILEANSSRITLLNRGTDVAGKNFHRLLGKRAKVQNVTKK